MEHPENSEEYKGLTVNSGVEQPAIINPYLNRRRFRRRVYSVAHSQIFRTRKSRRTEKTVRNNICSRPFRASKGNSGREK